MNIGGIYLPGDILNTIFYKLSAKDGISWIRTCKTIHRAINKNFFNLKQLTFARELIRYVHGPIYLIQKYNLFDFLEFYLKNKASIERDKFECQNNIKLYQYLIQRYPQNILNLEATVCHYDDIENMKRLKLDIPLGKYGYPINITLFLLPQVVKKRTRQDINIIPGFKLDSLLILGNTILLDEYYLRFPRQVLNYIYHFRYPVSTILWLSNKNLIPREINVNPSFELWTAETIEFLHQLGVKFITQDSRRLPLIWQWYKITHCPESVVERFSDYSRSDDGEIFEYLQYYLNSIHPENRPEKIKIKHCSLYFYCFCTVYQIKVVYDEMVTDIISQEQDWDKLKEKGIEIIKEGLVDNLEVELCKRDLCQITKISFDFFSNLNKFDHILHICDKQTINQIFRFSLSTGVYGLPENRPLLDIILSDPHLRNQLEYHDNSKVNLRIMVLLGKCSIFKFVPYCGVEIKNLCDQYQIPFAETIKWTGTNNIDALNLPIETKSRFRQQFGNILFKLIVG